MVVSQLVGAFHMPATVLANNKAVCNSELACDRIRDLEATD